MWIRQWLWQWWHSLKQSMQSTRGRPRRTRREAVLPQDWYSLRIPKALSREEEAQNKAWQEAKDLKELEEFRALLEVSGWRRYRERLEVAARYWAEILVNGHWKQCESPEQFAYRMDQAQNIIATIRNMANIPAEVIAQAEEESKSKGTKTDGRRI